MKTETYEEAQRSDATDGRLLSGVGSLIRQDPIRRTLRYSIPIAIVVGAIMRLITGPIPDHDVSLPMSGHPYKIVPIFVQLWIFNLLGVFVAHFNSRCSRMSLGLPIAPRKLWLVRILSVVAAGVIPAVILFFIIAQGGVMFAGGLNYGLLYMGGRIIAGLVLAIVLFQIPSPGVYRISGNKRFVLYVVLVSTGVILYTVFTPQLLIYTILPLAAALAIGLRVYATLPSGFVLAPVRPESWRPSKTAVGGAASEAITRRGNPIWRLHITVWRTLMNTWSAWAMLALLVLYGVFLTVLYHNGVTEGAEFFFALLWWWILLCISIGRLPQLDPLPVSRRLPFAHVIVTGLLAMALGYGIVMLKYRFASEPPAVVLICEKEICVPAEFWEIARDGAPPTVISPWGETHTPHANRLTRGGKMAVYNPYEYGPDASPRFVKYQIDRAVSRIHGSDALAVTVASDTPLDDEFIKGAIEDGWYKVPESAGRGSEVRSKTAAVTIALFAVLFALLNLVWFQRFRAAAPIRSTRWFAILFFTLPHVLVLMAVILEIRMNANAKSTLKLPLIIARRAVEAVPVGPAAVWLVSLLVVIASYLVIQRYYIRLEAPPGKSGKRFLSEY